ncbi:MAG: hypothetical protein ABJB76_09220 [Candidatus Nitrosocosmicus sp.]
MIKFHIYYINRKETINYQEEKEYNKSHSKKKWIVIEHTIYCRMKKYGIFVDVFRKKIEKYNKV